MHQTIDYAKILLKLGHSKIHFLKQTEDITDFSLRNTVLVQNITTQLFPRLLTFNH